MSASYTIKQVDCLIAVKKNFHEIDSGMINGMQ